MGLDELVSDKGGSPSSSSSTRRKSSSQQQEDRKVIGSDPYKKVFSKEKWEEVKEVIHHEMDVTVNQVLNNFTAEDRFEALHEAATFVDGELDEDEIQNWSKTRCFVCNNDCTETGVEIEGETFCIHHTVGQVQKALEE